MESEGRAWLTEEGVPQDLHAFSRWADLRYTHQGSEVTVGFGTEQGSAQILDSVIREFHTRHKQLYGFVLDQPVEIVTLRVAASGDVGLVDMPQRPSGLDSPKKAIASKRQVFFEEAGGFVQANVFHFDRLAPGSNIDGPAILEGMDSTVLINPGWTGHIDEYGNCIMEPSK